MEDNRKFAVMRRIVGKFMLAVSGCLPTAWLESLVGLVIAGRANSLPPAEALHFLFHIDRRLYDLEGIKAIEYDGGIHTKHRHIRYHDFFVARVRPGEKVLDIGCGNGAVAHDIAEHSGATVVGIDLDAQNIAMARSRYAHPRAEYRAGNVLTDLPVERFDVVILSNVLEHLPGRSAFLRRIAEAALPSRLLIRVPLFERDWRVPLTKELGLDYRLDPTHETEYTLESFAEEMAEAGLKVVHQEVRWGEIWAEAVPCNEILVAE
jgi:SAM-dependent methyltransferase